MLNNDVELPAAIGLKKGRNESNANFHGWTQYPITPEVTHQQLELLNLHQECVFNFSSSFQRSILEKKHRNKCLDRLNYSFAYIL